MKIVIATHNKGKIVEFQRMLEPMGIEVVTAELSEPEETGKTFMENAFIKAESACKEMACPQWRTIPACAWIIWTALRGSIPPGLLSPASGG